MAQLSEISWTDATFNPWWGCTKISPACDHCYAETFARRVGFSETGSQFTIWGHDSQRRFFGDKHWFEPLKWNHKAGVDGHRVRVFCGSMCDVTEDRLDLVVPRWRLALLIDKTPSLDWLLLTKRPQNFRRLLPCEWAEQPRKNVWLMTTVEAPKYFWRIQELRKVPAVIRGLSMEPLLEKPSGLEKHLDGIAWVITGGESGAHHRASGADWFLSRGGYSVSVDIQPVEWCMGNPLGEHLIIRKCFGDWLPIQPILKVCEGNGSFVLTKGEYFAVEPSLTAPDYEYYERCRAR